MQPLGIRNYVQMLTYYHHSLVLLVFARRPEKERQMYIWAKIYKTLNGAQCISAVHNRAQRILSQNRLTAYSQTFSDKILRSLICTIVHGVEV